MINEYLPGEEVIQYSDNNLVTLTTHRIRFNYKTWGEAKVVSIMLEKVSSVEISYISFPMLLLLGIVAIATAVISGANDNGDVFMISIVAAAILLIGYFGSRKHVFSIASDGGAKIVFKTKGMSTQSLISFIDKIELAKNSRLKELQTARS